MAEGWGGAMLVGQQQQTGRGKNNIHKDGGSIHLEKPVSKVAMLLPKAAFPFMEELLQYS